MIESIGIGAETEHADKNAKQAGSRFKEIFVVASRFRSTIAGVSAMLETPFRKVEAARERLLARRLALAGEFPPGHYARLAQEELSKCNSVAAPVCGLWPRGESAPQLNEDC